MPSLSFSKEPPTVTSGSFSSFPVAAIFVDRTKRQRRELRNIEELAASIQQNGLIHPPVIRKSGELIVGERRWTAIKSLGWTDMPVQFVEDLDPQSLHRIELEENVRRSDLTWQEQCDAIKQYHSMCKAENEEWSLNGTASILGFSPEFVGQAIAVAKELEAGNKMVIEAPKFSTARNITQRKLERERTSTLAAIKPATKIAEATEKLEPVIPLLHADFAEWAPRYDGPKFNLIHCDFPYGVGMHQSDQGAGKEFGTYADSEDVYWELLKVLHDAMCNVVAESAHLIFWFSMDFYSKTKSLLEEMGWKVSPFPLIWMKSDNVGILPDAARGPRRIYETAFFASRGDRKVFTAVGNAFAHPGREKELHMNEKPLPMLRHFLRMVTDQYSSMLDPTCGSANAVKAASLLGAHTVLGIERDENFFNAAKGAWNAEL